MSTLGELLTKMHRSIEELTALMERGLRKTDEVIGMLKESAPSDPLSIVVQDAPPPDVVDDRRPEVIPERKRRNPVLLVPYDAERRKSTYGTEEVAELFGYADTRSAGAVIAAYEEAFGPLPRMELGPREAGQPSLLFDDAAMETLMRVEKITRPLDGNTRRRSFRDAMRHLKRKDGESTSEAEGSNDPLADRKARARVALTNAALRERYVEAESLLVAIEKPNEYVRVGPFAEEKRADAFKVAVRRALTEEEAGRLAVRTSGRFIEARWIP